MSHALSNSPSCIARLTPPIRRRVVFLVTGNAVLLAAIFGILLLRTDGELPARLATAGARLGDELGRFGPNAAPVVLAALGMTGIVLAGAIDLSVGGVVALSGTVFGILYEWGAPPTACFAACFGTAVAAAANNALLVRLLRIPAIIVTLAGLTFYRGAALLLADVALEDFGGQISILHDAWHVPGRDLASWVLAIAVVLSVVWESWGRMPRLWLASGGSAEAFRLKGLSPGSALTGAFLVGGAYFGLAAVLLASNQLTIEPSRIGLGFELQVIGAVVLGGTNIFGGEGSYLGTALGAAFLHFVGQAMIYAGVSEYWQTAIQGGVILAVIGFDCALHRRRKRFEELR
jgi:ribose/xylose/arabinose/galactoside ABC-type transport system permease subunit